jgi:CRP/FNR family transcriptional regulator, nitrogen oxide reductase regulator
MPHLPTENAESLGVIRTSALFCGLPTQECLQIVGGARRRSFSRDESLFMKEQPVRHVLMVKSGSVKLTQLSTNGSEVILWLIGAGDLIGGLGWAAGGIHTCSARVVTDCTALVWDYARFESILTDCPLIQRNLGLIMSERLAELEERFREIATEPVGKRVALALVRLLQRVGVHSSIGIEVNMSREELAQMTGTTLFTISRLICEWERKGLVLPRRGAVIVRYPDRLLMEGCSPE